MFYFGYKKVGSGGGACHVFRYKRKDWLAHLWLQVACTNLGYNKVGSGYVPVLFSDTER